MELWDWEQLFINEKSQKKIREAVTQAVRTHLVNLAPGIILSTRELADAIYPLSVAEQSERGDVTRKQLFVMLAKLATEDLNDCCMKGEVRGQYMGKPRRPWLWFCPEGMEICPTCHQFMMRAQAD